MNLNVRERLFPRNSDLGYIHLGDLRLALDKFRNENGVSILDLGCGNSPYRSLFPKSDYRRADLATTPDIDYVIGPHSDIPGEHFDMVLSTQVLEHVNDPESYLEIALKSLKSGGRLILTTHGMYEEHACPYDFHRWTALGLKNLLTKCGFIEVKVWKVSTRQRAIAYLILQHFGLIGLKRRSVVGVVAAVCNKILQFSAPLMHWWLDRWAADCRIVDANTPDHTLYLVLMVEGRKA